MKKIGIYTFFWTSYGAVLQAYSLSRTLKALFPEDLVMVVKYQSPTTKLNMSVFGRKATNPLTNVLWNFFASFRYRQLKHRFNLFEVFRNQHFQFTQLYDDHRLMVASPPQLDVHISGSDQVFNPRKPARDVFYLNFEKGQSRKVAYAPSFGISEFTEEEMKYIRHCLSDFDFLSCREESGAMFMSDLLDREVSTVIDPVFLTPANEWEKIAKAPYTKERYVFIFSLMKASSLLRIARKLPKEYSDCKIIVLSPHDWRFYTRCKHIYNPGPREFVGLIRNAELVLTDSFHGTAFSILFHKKFYTYISQPKYGSRIISLLGSLALDDRVLHSSDSIPTAYHVVDYQSKLDSMVKDSICYLKQAISR